MVVNTPPKRYYFSPEELREARLALEAEGWVCETHLGLLEAGVVMVIHHPKTGDGRFLSPSEVSWVARYGPQELYHEDGAPSGFGVSGSPHEPGYYARRYLERALAGILSRWRNEAVEGNRNNALNRLAYFMGRLVGGGILSLEEALAMIEQEAATVFHSQEWGEVRATTKSGLEAGMRNPVELTLPPPPKKAKKAKKPRYRVASWRQKGGEK